MVQSRIFPNFKSTITKRIAGSSMLLGPTDRGHSRLSRRRPNENRRLRAEFYQFEIDYIQKQPLAACTKSNRPRAAEVIAAAISRSMHKFGDNQFIKWLSNLIFSLQKNTFISFPNLIVQGEGKLPPKEFELGSAITFSGLLLSTYHSLGTYVNILRTQ